MGLAFTLSKHLKEIMKIMLKLLALLLLVSATLISLPARAETNAVYTGYFSDKAASGYDVVAYFTVGKPTEGSAEFSHSHAGATWLFSSAANRDAFIADPAKYAPQYGGYCAWAVSQNKTASGDPEFWKIVDGKLYFNYDADVQKKWELDIPSFILAANKNWPVILKE